MKYTECSATMAVSSDWYGGKKYYTKTGLSAKKIQNYKTAASLGIGVKLTNINGDTIEMEGGHNVHKVVKEKLVGPAGLKAIWR